MTKRDEKTFCGMLNDDSDVSCYHSAFGRVEIMVGAEAHAKGFTYKSFDTYSGALKYIKQMKGKGVRIPQYAIDELIYDARITGDKP